MARIRTDFYMGETRVSVLGDELFVGDEAPQATVLDAQTNESFDFDELKGKVSLIMAVPSIDTAVCACESQHFNEEVAKISGLSTYLVSCDLPFAQTRYAAEHGLDNIVFLSDHRAASFGTKYGCLIGDVRLLARAVFVVGADGKLAYVEYLKQTKNEPDYEAALQVCRELLAE